MPATGAAPRPPAVDEPKHPLHALTTYELTKYRRQLDNAITFYDTQDAVPSARDGLKARLDAVIAGQDDRTRLADHA